MTTATQLLISAQSIGIDVDSRFLKVAHTIRLHTGKLKVHRSHTFNNTAKGFEALLTWTQTSALPDLPIAFIMEATGSYHEALAYFLIEQHQTVHVELPNKIKHYIQSYNQASHTDALDAKMIGFFGLERPLHPWQPPSTNIYTLKALTRELEELAVSITRIDNQLHALQYAHQVNAAHQERLKQRRRFLQQQRKEILAQLKTFIAQDPVLHQQVDCMTSTPNVGILTAATVLAETNGFAGFHNTKQLTSYAGLDVKHNQSGKFVGKTTISKKGNAHLRRILYMPAMQAGKTNHPFHEFFLRTKANTGSGKAATVATARKILILLYSLCKNKQTYEDAKMQNPKTSSTSQCERATLDSPCPASTSL